MDTKSLLDALAGWTAVGRLISLVWSVTTVEE